MIKSLLFVSGDRPDRMEKALAAGADAIILDLEDSVSPAAKEQARQHVASFLRQHNRSTRLFVRINPLEQGMLDKDLPVVLENVSYGIVLPKAEGGSSLAKLDRHLVGTNLVILAIVTETPKAVFETGTYGGITPRLFGLTWGAEDLSAAVGASQPREKDGSYRPAYQLTRSLTLFGAAAAGVAPIEAVYPAYRDLEGLAAYAVRAREDGFKGMMAIHPSQVPVINAAFRPTNEEVERARKIIALFEANPDTGALSFEGGMIDAPHLKEAIRLLKVFDEGVAATQLSEAKAPTG